MDGGSQCGGVRYRLHEQPTDSGWCHCTICRRVSGAPALVYASVPRPAFVLTEQAQLRTIRTTSFGERLFCGRCGAQVAMRVDYEPDTIDVAVATMVEPEQAPPRFHIFFADRIGWFDPADSLPRYAQGRPETGALRPGVTSVG